MPELVAATLLWAFSFGLIKGELAGLDPAFVAAVRLVIAAVLFAPGLLRRPRPVAVVRSALLLGAVQFGLMYVLYIASYRWLPAWAVALFTVFTPLYVVLFADAAAGRLRPVHLAAAVTAVAGALVAVWRELPTADVVRGALLLQAANLCFAFGQVRYRRLQRRPGPGSFGLLAWMYVGAAIAASLLVPWRGVPAAADLGWRAGAVLLYLGALPTAAGFFLWNRGAARTGSGRLAVANNLKIPAAMIVAWLVFGEQAAYGRALAGLGIILLAFALTGRRPSATDPS